MISSSGTSTNSSPFRMPLTYRIGFPLGSWIMRNETASSVETAGQSLTGMRTSDRRRLPDQSEGGGMTQLELRTTAGRIWGYGACAQENKQGTPNFFE